MLDASLRRRLLELARGAVEAAVRGESGGRGREGARPADSGEPAWAELPSRGVFVTLSSGGRLRGCIGTFHPQGPLNETVRAMAAAAASDPRFVERPIHPEDVSGLRIEISVLSALERTDSPHSLKIGTHGLYIRSPGGTGCFLPQVAVEFGWDAAEFLSRCCTEKAGLGSDDWRRPDTEVYLFTVEKFEDSPPRSAAT